MVFVKDAKTLFPLKILVAEDARDVLMLFERLLARYGATVTGASNGLDALEKSQAEEFDIILMDMEMPVLNGVDSAARMREAGITLPIIALTGHSNEYAKSQSADGCFNGFLQKPVDTDVMLQMIVQQCEGKLHKSQEI